MAGHNKWSKIKHIKARMDAKKGKAFSKAGRELTISARLGGADPDMNPALRLAIQHARSVNMPKDTIQRAIEKGVGGGDAGQLDDVTYEAYAPGGVALLIRALTDNKNRTAPNIRAMLSKAGGQLACPGSVQYLFDQKGVVLFDSVEDPDSVASLAIDAGADDVDIQDDGGIEVIAPPQQFDGMLQALTKHQVPFLTAALQMVPQTRIPLNNHQAQSLLQLIDTLEDNDDIQDVYHNADMPEVEE